MDTHKIKRDLSRCSIAELQELRRYATERIAVLTKRNRVASHEEAWESFGKKAKTGLYLLMTQGFSGRLFVWRKEGGKVKVSRNGRRSMVAEYGKANLSAGTVLKISIVQPRKRILWLESDWGDIYGFKPADLAAVGPGNLHLYADELRANIARVRLCPAEHGAEAQQCPAS